MSRSNDIANITSSVLDGVTKAEVGLGNVDNTADSAKPVSTAQQSAIDGLAFQSVPHIIPDVLYPSYVASGTTTKLLDGSTTHGTGTYGGSAVSTNYGTVQADGRKYYYTNIAGSKPIKDPRIGGHFGSQRHKFKSLQKLEQETATHGKNVYSVDGREWCRWSGTFVLQNNDQGNVPFLSSNGSFIEITGYFSEANIISLTYSSGRYYKWKIDGGSFTEKQDFRTNVNTPLASRYVDAGSVANIGISQTLGIHTLTIQVDAGQDTYVYGIELIAQDTTSTANRSKIQIPSQDVVSYGKKFTVSAEGSSGHHYDPFNGFVNGTSLHSAFVDTATSLGLDTAPGSSAKWAISSTNNVRPYNGGRVVKWIDSSGVIKTSVNMMPPNAQNVAGSVAGTTEVTTPSATNTTPTPIFSDDAIDHSQAELAKAFHFREFGNGSANGGTGAANYADWSMLTASNDDVAYVMDDGLTSLAGDTAYAEVNSGNGEIHYPGQSTYYSYLTFIGTGISIKAEKELNKPVEHIAQNLPYGTHVVKFVRSGSNSQYIVDGVDLGAISNTGYGGYTELLLKQPKRPPIPEDACVLADYMLMADFVGASPASGTDNLIHLVSKGVRAQDISTDILWDETTNDYFNFTWCNPAARGGHYASLNSGNISSGEAFGKLPYFGTTVDVLPYADRISTLTEYINSTSVTKTDVSTTGWSGRARATGQALGLNGIKLNKTAGNFTIQGLEIAIPIHTSSHYQSFETPYLHELVGGDRNMEQHNLVVSPDGKTWDQLTRDTSYLGDVVVSAWNNLKNGSYGNANTDVVIWDIHRGDIHDTGINPASNQLHRPFFCKRYFAIAYDRHICLEDGVYTIVYSNILNSTTNTNQKVLVNQEIVEWAHGTGDYSHATLAPTIPLKRGDYVQVSGGYFGADDELYGRFEIRKVSQIKE